MHEYQSSISDLLLSYQTSKDGLTDTEAQNRLNQYGPNQLVTKLPPSLFARFMTQMKNPMILILIIAAAISGITAAYEGEPFTDAIIIFIVVLINGVLGVFQENKAERALLALQNMAAPTANVIRDGKRKTIPREHLVPGDVIRLEAGDAVPADARVWEAASLRAEEAALTGESTPVDKQPLPLPEDNISLGDRTNMVYMGSTIVYGRGTAIVTQTGMHTEMGHIAGALSATHENDTPLQRKLNQLSRILSILVLATCTFLFLFQIFRFHENLSGTIVLETFLATVSLAVAAIPEGLAAVVTIVLSIGVTRMSKQNAIIRRLTAVEALGCAQVICSDKTGTLTQNRMTVLETSTDQESLLAAVMALCSDAGADETGHIVGEPTECALVSFASELSLEKSYLEKLAPRIGEAPFDSERKRMSTLHSPTPKLRRHFHTLTAQLPKGAVLQCTKGAPDEVLALCTSYWKNLAEPFRPMTDALKQEILETNRHFAEKALRVLAAAIRIHPVIPDDQSPASLEKDLCFLGLVGMMDPVRPEVKDAIAKCRSAGIRPIMITGDHKDTAVTIAAELGILTSNSLAITGMELDQLSETAFASQVADFSVYARVRPEHKVRIVQAWKDAGYVTAMTGDGVNDAPSIKHADIGIGMGITGTDVTKNTADLILADDHFATIVSAVQEGRRIYANIRKSIQFLLASNLAEVLAIFFSNLMGFSILRPIHLLWINLITDTFPALALGMENGEPDLMTMPPRDPKESLFAGGVGIQIIYQGICIMGITLLAYFVGNVTMAFLTLSMTEIIHAFNMRSLTKSIFCSSGHNFYLWGAAFTSLAATVLLLIVPSLRHAFGLSLVTPIAFLISLGIASLIVPLVELGKLFQRR